MFEEKYEIRLDEKDIELTKDTWENIRDYSDDHVFFFIECGGQYYKYVGFRAFDDRPAKFNFKVARPIDRYVKIIHVLQE